MEQLRSLSLILMSLLLCFCFTDGDITHWEQDSSGTPTAGATTTFSVSAAEDTSDTATILTVTATTDETTDTTITYDIGTQPNAGQFEVSSSGVVTLVTNKSLDCETDASLQVKVTATDAKPATGTVTVDITVTDVNDNTPAFTAPSNSVTLVALDDQSAAGTAVYTVTATDVDCSETTITYSIASGNTNTDFAIVSSSGAITVANALDRSVTCEYFLVIEATDSGTSPGPKSASVTVKVEVCDFSSSDCNCVTGTSEDSGAGTIAVSSLTVLVLLLVYVYQFA